jgi:hypothetical protein
MPQKNAAEEITATQAMDRLHLTRKGVIYLIDHQKLTARLADAPKPYYLIAVDDKFLSEEKQRSQAKA